jgi:transposase-like protein
MNCPKCDAVMMPNGRAGGSVRTSESWHCPECGYEWALYEGEQGCYFCFGSEHQSFLAAPPQGVPDADRERGG